MVVGVESFFEHQHLVQCQSERIDKRRNRLPGRRRRPARCSCGACGRQPWLHSGNGRSLCLHLWRDRPTPSAQPVAPTPVAPLRRRPPFPRGRVREGFDSRRPTQAACRRCSRRLRRTRSHRSTQVSSFRSRAGSEGKPAVLLHGPGTASSTHRQLVIRHGVVDRGSLRRVVRPRARRRIAAPKCLRCSRIIRCPVTSRSYRKNDISSRRSANVFSWFSTSQNASCRTSDGATRP